MISSFTFLAEQALQIDHSYKLLIKERNVALLYAHSCVFIGDISKLAVGSDVVEAFEEKKVNV